MIELQKYSKLDDERLLKSSLAKHTDSRMKVVGYVSLALVVTLVGITYQLGKTTFMQANERNLFYFEKDSQSETMKLFLNFVSHNGKSYVDRSETAKRYNIFKANYEKA